MSNSSPHSEHKDVNAPKLPSPVYLEEKAKFAGDLLCGVFYGIVIILFFQCMGALLNPMNHTKRGPKRLLVVHTMAMFLFVTISTAVNLNFVSVGYVDNREFPGTDEASPGPFGYQNLLYSNAIGIVPTVMFLLNNWLADGLLIYRCYIIYCMDYRAISLPCLMYLATFATGIALVYYQISQPTCTIWRSSAINIGIPYSISVSLDVLVTFMIILRLVLLSRKLQKAMNAPFKLGGLYTAVVTVLSESSALYAVTFLLFIGTWAADHPTEYFFWQILSQAQVIAPFLIILRVANRKGLTSEVAPGAISSIKIGRRESIGSSGTSLNAHSPDSTVVGGKTLGEFGDRVVATVDLDHDKTQEVIRNP